MTMQMPRLRGLALMLMLSVAGASAAPPPNEYQVKAAYLFNFGQFVEWPATAFVSPAAPFVIGVVGDDPFDGILDDLVRGESIEGHPLQVKRFRRASEVIACNILFITRSEASNLEQILDAVRGHSVLTVTDADASESREATIVLVNDHNRIRMRINLASARASNLVISSKLLRPAEVVEDPGNRP